MASSGTNAQLDATSGSGVASHPCIAQLQTGTTTTGRTTTLITETDSILLGSGAAYAYGSFRIPTLSDGSNRFTVRAGFIDTGAGDGTDGAFLRYADNVNSGKFQCVTRAASSETATDTGVTAVAGDWYAFEIVVNSGATSATCAINGAVVATNSTNVPSGTGQETGIAAGVYKSVGTTERVLDLDFIAGKIDFTSARGSYEANNETAGSTYIGTLPSFDNPPATANANNCEFDGSLCGWTWSADAGSTAPASGTANPTAAVSGDPVYDLTSWPGFMLVQSDESSQVALRLKQAVTLDTNATIVAAVSVPIRDVSASAEGSIYLYLTNSGDTNEIVYSGIANTSGAGYTCRGAIFNNGSETAVAGPTLSENGDLVRVYLWIFKTGDTYKVACSYGDLRIPDTFGTTLTKTGVTTLNELQIMVQTANETPSIIWSVNWVRYYASNTIAIVNAPTTQGTDIAPYGQYGPDNPPTSCASCEEWTGDAASLTWAWANQDSATSSVDHDGEFLVGDATNELHVRYVSGVPTNSDQTWTVKIDNVFDGSSSSGDSCGIIVLHGGTEASPTDVTYMMYGDFATDGIYYQADSDYAPAAGSSTIASSAWSLSHLQGSPLYLQMRYVDSTRVTVGLYSFNGIDWTPMSATDTLTNDPIAWGTFVRLGAQCRISWARLRTDANKNDAGE